MRTVKPTTTEANRPGLLPSRNVTGMVDCGWKETT